MASLASRKRKNQSGLYSHPDERSREAQLNVELKEYISEKS